MSFMHYNRSIGTGNYCNVLKLQFTVACEKPEMLVMMHYEYAGNALHKNDSRKSNYALDSKVYLSV